MNDTVMKAHQNRNMTYDEMHDYEMFNGAAHTARGNLLSIYGIIKILLFRCSTSVKLASRHITIHLDHAWHLPIVVGTPSGQSGQF